MALQGGGPAFRSSIPHAGFPGRVLGGPEAAHHYSSDEKRHGISGQAPPDSPPSCIVWGHSGAPKTWTAYWLQVGSSS